MEALVYLNLTLLSATTLAELNRSALVYFLVGTVFILVTAIAAYQLHLLYIAKTKLWAKLKAKVRYCLQVLKPSPKLVVLNEVAGRTTTSHDPHRIVTRTVMELREPMLEDSYTRLT